MPNTASPLDLATLIPRCHEASKANGWWDVKPNPGQALMLVVSELSEALEADRNGRYADLAGYLSHAASIEEVAPGFMSDAAFKSLIKDTVADELADAYIRLCDFAGGFGLSITSVVRHRDAERAAMDRTPETLNLGECLLAITQNVVDIHGPHNTAENMGIALATTEKVCELFAVDLATHIDLKLAYNATRGQKHGGKAY